MGGDMKMFRSLALIVLLTACGRGGDSTGWNMDPRVADLARWAYACTQQVLALNPADYGPAPNVKAVENKWNGNVTGSYFERTNTVKVWLNAPNLPDIMLHEMGHWAYIVFPGTPGADKEEFANMVNNLGRAQCGPPPLVVM